MTTRMTTREVLEHKVQELALYEHNVRKLETELRDATARQQAAVAARDSAETQTLRQETAGRAAAPSHAARA